MTLCLRAIACACSLLLCAAAPGAAAEPIKLVSRGDSNAAYAIKLLQLALSKAGVDDDLSIKDEALTATRLRQGLLDGVIDVIWTSTTKDLETAVIPVRIPLYKGLLGNRIFIVHRDNSDIFADVRSLADLEAFSYCQGRTWADTAILESNGLPVVSATKYEGLFHMVDGGRCDAFPRGVHEPWDEIKRRPDLELTIDTHVMLRYVSPYYYFVSPHRPEIAEKIEAGLRAAIADGSFDEYFYADPTIKSVLEQAQMDKRRVFYIDNPALPEKTPTDDKVLWY